MNLLITVIGKGGEQIAAIQAETGCKVQFAPDSGGSPDRPCTLTGSPESIEYVLNAYFTEHF
jgi:far upstream element-binding protein